jgi:hypothetical protein
LEGNCPAPLETSPRSVHARARLPARHAGTDVLARRGAPERARALKRPRTTLRYRGHDVVAAGEWSLGRVSAAGREPDGIPKAAANARGMQGYAVGR